MNKQIRRISKNGAICIPVDIRRAFGWGPGVRVEVVVSSDGNSITLKKIDQVCFLTNETDNLLYIGNGMYISKSIINNSNIKKIFETWRSPELERLMKESKIKNIGNSKTKEKDKYVEKKKDSADVEDKEATKKGTSKRKRKKI